MKKAVSSSNLSLRFYLNEGWTRDDIEPYLISGKILNTQETHNDAAEWAYYILDVDSRLDMKRFYEEKVSTVYRRYDDYPNQTDLQFLESKNW